MKIGRHIFSCKNPNNRIFGDVASLLYHGTETFRLTITLL